MRKIFTLLFIMNCFSNVFCQAPVEGEELSFKSKTDGRQYILKVVENRPLENNPLLHFHATPLMWNIAQTDEMAVQIGAGADIYLLKTLQINADFKVSWFDLEKLAYSADGAAGPHIYQQFEGSVGVSYGAAFTGRGAERVELGYGSRGYQSVRYYARPEEITRGFHVGGRGGYTVHSGYYNYRDGNTANVITNSIYLGVYMTRIRDFFVRNDSKLEGRFAAQKVYADLLLPFYNAGTVYNQGYDSAYSNTKVTGFHPGFRIGLGIFPPVVRVKGNGNLSKVAFYMNFETGMRAGTPATQTYPFYGSIGIGLSYMTFKPHLNGDNVKTESKKHSEHAPAVGGH